MEHNHSLSTTPSKSRLHRSHSALYRSDIVRQLVCSLNSEGIGPSNIARVCNAASGWTEQHITSRQCGEIVRQERRNNVGRECREIVRYFKQRQEEDGSYFFAMDLGEDGTLRSVLWADG